MPWFFAPPLLLLLLLVLVLLPASPLLPLLLLVLVLLPAVPLLLAPLRPPSPGLPALWPPAVACFPQRRTRRFSPPS